jgi:hypothetical protein
MFTKEKTLGKHLRTSMENPKGLPTTNKGKLEIDYPSPILYKIRIEVIYFCHYCQ